ncbi:flagellar hook-length control protein FliK [Salimicrobium halophilum]|uniref:Hook-length control protein FliK n=1 Tax=Salimicrobium halophilum TaxID=86666 RepID=A0A1G8QAJ2_9BACI|nr:flagellar hook-length control protein FliK [Salimicrobium halophilum]SDJ01814.1 hook-length control protein FliK [Salimicrobium halophilum]
MQMMELLTSQVNIKKTNSTKGNINENMNKKAFGEAISLVMEETQQSEGSKEALMASLSGEKGMFTKAQKEELMKLLEELKGHMQKSSSSMEQLLSQGKSIFQSMNGNNQVMEIFQSLSESEVSQVKEAIIAGNQGDLPESLLNLEGKEREAMLNVIELISEGWSSPNGENGMLNFLKNLSAEDFRLGEMILSNSPSQTVNMMEKDTKKWNALVEKLRHSLNTLNEGKKESEKSALIQVLDDIQTFTQSLEDNFLTGIHGFQQNIQKVAGETASSNEQLTEIFQSFRGILSLQEGGKTSLKEVTNAQLKELRELLVKFVNESKGVDTQALLNQSSGKPEDKALFEQLIRNVQRKQQLPTVYNQQQITVKDIGKWLSHSTKIKMEESSLNTGNDKLSTISHQTPMTKVEQFVIKVDQQSQAPAQRQVFQKLQDMIQSSKMFTDKLGNQEMQIKLKPSSLGDMTIKFAQVNGEMAVKIMVTSQAAKEMLEGNMQQLRHMFSPQQVVVEKTEQTLNQQFLNEDEAENFHEGEEQSSGQEFDEDFEEDEGEESAVSFSDILNEKV